MYDIGMYIIIMCNFYVCENNSFLSQPSFGLLLWTEFSKQKTLSEMQRSQPTQGFRVAGERCEIKWETEFSLQRPYYLNAWNKLTSWFDEEAAVPGPGLDLRDIPGELLVVNAGGVVVGLGLLYGRPPSEGTVCDRNEPNDLRLSRLLPSMAAWSSAGVDSFFLEHS